MQLARSGVSTLDLVLGGGLPAVPNIVVSGDEQSVYIFSTRLALSRLNAGDLCVYETASRTREDVIAGLVLDGGDVSDFIRTGVLRVLDYRSWLEAESFGTPEENQGAFLHNCTNAPSPELFHEVFLEEFIAAREDQPNRGLFAVLDSLDRLVGVMGLENTLSLINMLSKTLSRTSSIGVALLCNEYLSEETAEAIRKEASLFIELRRDGKGKDGHRTLRVSKSPRDKSANQWVPWY